MTRTIPTTQWSPPLRLAIAAVLALTLAAPLQANDPTKQAKATTEKAEKAMASKAGKTVAADRNFLDKAIQGSEKEIAATMLAQERASDAKVRQMATDLRRDHLTLLSKLDETAVALGVRDARTYTYVATSTPVAPAAVAGNATTDLPGSTASTDTTASSGYVDDMTASGSSTLGGSTLSAGAAGTTPATPSGSQPMLDESSALATPGISAAKKDPAVQALSRQAGAPFDRAFLDQLISSHEKSVADFTKASGDMSLSSQSRRLAEESLPTLRDHLAMAKDLRTSLAGN